MAEPGEAVIGLASCQCLHLAMPGAKRHDSVKLLNRGNRCKLYMSAPVPPTRPPSASVSPPTVTAAVISADHAD